MADLELIQDLAISALNDWKEELPGWTFAWNNRTTSLGLCVYRKNQIQISKQWAAVLTDDEVMDTVLHELAHALAWVLHQCHNHGPVWKKMCLELGASPSVTEATSVPPTALAKKAKWEIHCDVCGTTTLRYRKPKNIKKYACMVCRKRGDGNGNLILTQCY